MLTPTHKLRVAVLTTSRAPGLRTLLRAAETDGYEVAAVVASDPASSAMLDAAGSKVPCLVHDLRAFYRNQNRRIGDLDARQGYDAATAALLHGFHPDVVVTCGYLHILTAPMLAAFPDRILNIHDSDMRLRERDGLPRHRGLHATLDAILAGERETRSTVHIARESVDTGPGILVSEPFPVHRELVAAAVAGNARDILKAYAYAQREWMMRTSWGPLLHTALSLFADDGVEVMGSSAWVRGVPGPLVVHEHEEAKPRPTARVVVRP